MMEHNDYQDDALLKDAVYRFILQNQLGVTLGEITEHFRLPQSRLQHAIEQLIALHLVFQETETAGFLDFEVYYPLVGGESMSCG